MVRGWKYLFFGRGIQTTNDPIILDPDFLEKKTYRWWRESGRWPEWSDRPGSDRRSTAKSYRPVRSARRPTIVWRGKGRRTFCGPTCRWSRQTCRHRSFHPRSWRTARWSGKALSSTQAQTAKQKRCQRQFLTQFHLTWCHLTRLNRSIPNEYPC